MEATIILNKFNNSQNQEYYMQRLVIADVFYDNKVRIDTSQRGSH